MRKPIIAGNWKMNKTPEEAAAFFENLPFAIRNEKKVEMVICPPFLCLDRLSKAMEGTSITLGAQNMHWENNGAFTGEISASMLKAAGCAWVLIGHSERRQFFGDNDIGVNLKLKKAMDTGLKPIMCIGETLSERESGNTDQVIVSQLETGLSGIKLNQGSAENFVIAYEPVWAIGTGKTCDSTEANRVIALIRNTLAKHYQNAVADEVRILYGGSAKPENIRELLSMSDIDGGLIGGASLEPGSFVKLVENIL
jgi:triosephosphate isomerase